MFKQIAAITGLAVLLLSSLEARAITISTVPIGNVGNANDPATGNIYGGVSYAYRIGTYEVTVGQYTAFLNAVAVTDTYALYDTAMATNLYVAGISRSGVSESYTYSVIGSANKPVTNVNWGDAVRFANWLHNNQPVGLQDATTTERGAYTLDGAITNAALNAATRNGGARWFLPTDNEWYKAAYHQTAAAGGDTDNYWEYPTRSNSEPYSDQPPGKDAPSQSNTANFLKDDGLANGYNDGYAVTGSASFNFGQNHLTDVGAYNLSIGPYGTFDQGGNLAEWNETLTNGSLRASRGGPWNGPPHNMRAQDPAATPPTTRAEIGFRVAAAFNIVPEPFTLVAAAPALAVLAGRLRRTRRRGPPCSSS